MAGAFPPHSRRTLFMNGMQHATHCHLLALVFASLLHAAGGGSLLSWVTARAKRGSREAPAPMGFYAKDMDLYAELRFMPTLKCAVLRWCTASVMPMCCQCTALVLHRASAAWHILREGFMVSCAELRFMPTLKCAVP